MRTGLREEMLNFLKIAVGLLISSLAYRMYLIPNDIAAGGFTGIGQIVRQLTGMQVGSVSIFLNVPLFAFSMKSLGIRFGVRSLIAMLGLSFAIDYLPVGGVTEDVLLASVFGGVLGGAGFGMILRGNATTGGSEMLASLLNRYLPNLKISVLVFSVDALVIFASAFVFDPSAAMYALISIFLMNVVLDFVLEGPNSARAYFIISKKSDEIAQAILQQLERGVTGLDARGMYSGEYMRVLLCVVNRMEAIKIRNIVFSIDPKAFMLANNTHEVLGEGFKSHGK